MLNLLKIAVFEVVIAILAALPGGAVMTFAGTAAGAVTAVLVFGWINWYIFRGKSDR